MGACAAPSSRRENSNATVSASASQPQWSEWRDELRSQAHDTGDREAAACSEPLADTPPGNCNTV